MSNQDNSRSAAYRVNPRTEKPRNAMLTEGQRAFLESDGSGYELGTQSEYRRSIRESVINTILDFTLLLEEWEESEREDVFRETNIDDDLRDGLASFIALLFLEKRSQSEFESLLSTGVNKAYQEMTDIDPFFANVDFSVTSAQDEDFESALDKIGIERIENLTDMEAQAFVRMLDRTFNINELLDMEGRFREQLETLKADRKEARMRIRDHRQEKRRNRIESSND